MRVRGATAIEMIGGETLERRISGRVQVYTTCE
jgi:hypothetical protein